MQTAAATSTYAAYEDAGPVMLAREPAEIEDRQSEQQQQQTWQWQLTYEHLQTQLETARTWRWPWWVHWARCAKVYLPYRWKWFVTQNQMNRGNPVNDAILNTTPVRALRVCGAGLLNGLMSRSRPWFRFDPAVPGVEVDTDGRAWLDDAADRVLTVLAGSNFYSAGYQLCEDVSAFGTSPMIIYEDYEDLIRCYVPVAGEYFCIAGGRNSVDALYREFTYTVQQCVDFFGLEACSPEIREQWRAGGAGRQTEHIIAHAIEPNYEIAGPPGEAAFSMVSGKFAYREVYWQRNKLTPAPFSVRGFSDRPAFVLRWSATSNDPYGRGVGMDVLGDGQQLQTEELRKAEFLDKGVRPAMGADPAMENRPSTIIPGGVTYIHGAQNGKGGFWPLFEPNPAWFGPITADIATIEKRVRDGFFEDVWLAISSMEGVQPRNELEISQRLAEKVQRLGPVIDLFEDEFASPALQRVVSIMERAHLFKPMPASLRKIGVKIEYTSILRTMQRAAETALLERGMQVATGLGTSTAQMGIPNPARIINWDQSFRLYLDRLGYPARGIHSVSEVESADEARMKEAQQRQAIEAAPGLAAAASSLGNIDVGGGQTAAGMLMGGQGGGGGAPGAAPAAAGAPGPAQ